MAIGFVAAGESSKRGHRLPAAARVDHHEGDEAPFRGPGGVASQPAGVIAVSGGDRGDAAAGGLFDGQVHRALPGHLPEAAPPVQNRRRDVIHRHGALGGGQQMLVLDGVEILGHPNDAVRVVPDEVRLDEVCRDECRVMLRRSRRQKSARTHASNVLAPIFGTGGSMRTRETP